MRLQNTVRSVEGLVDRPPTADCLTSAVCSDIIPPELLNFLAWCTGLTDDFTEDRVTIKSDDSMRKLAIAQDIITLSSSGQKLMLKQVTLGMTVRHLSGSAKIQQLLNNFGRCVSHSTTLEHDTALATQQLQLANDIPPGFKKKLFTTLVWDNNDFGEETLTGIFISFQHFSWSMGRHDPVHLSTCTEHFSF